MRRVTRTPGRTNVTCQEFLAGIERARERRAAFEAMAGRRAVTRPVEAPPPAPKEKRGRDWRRMDAARREAAVAAVTARVERGESLQAAVACVAAEHGMGRSTLSGFYHEARRARVLADVLQEAAP